MMTIAWAPQFNIDEECRQMLSFDTGDNSWEIIAEKKLLEQSRKIYKLMWKIP